MLNAGVQVLFTGHANSPEMLVEKFEQNAALVGRDIAAKETLYRSLGGIAQLCCVTRPGQARQRLLTELWTDEEAHVKAA